MIATLNPLGHNQGPQQIANASKDPLNGGSVSPQHTEQKVNESFQSQLEASLKQQGSNSAAQAKSSAEKPLTEGASNEEKPAEPESVTRSEMMQILLDKKLGIDRDKIEELEEEIEVIVNDPNLSPEQKQEMIFKLEKKIEALLEAARERMVEEEKRKAQLQTGDPLLNALAESAVKDRLETLRQEEKQVLS